MQNVLRNIEQFQEKFRKVSKKFLIYSTREEPWDGGLPTDKGQVLRVCSSATTSCSRAEKSVAPLCLR